jgi:hypothetical protein
MLPAVNTIPILTISIISIIQFDSATGGPLLFFFNKYVDAVVSQDYFVFLGF